MIHRDTDLIALRIATVSCKQVLSRSRWEVYSTSIALGRAAGEPRRWFFRARVLSPIYCTYADFRGAGGRAALDC